MTQKCRIRISRQHYNEVARHLFPGDGDEHGVVLLAGTSVVEGNLTLLIREIHPAREGIDYVEGKIGYRALTPKFIHSLITRARDQRLVYLAAHNHGSDLSVAFSHIDIKSHETGYPALLQIARGMPVGALVFGHRSVEADIWMPGGPRVALEEMIVVGDAIDRLRPSPLREASIVRDTYDRQVRMFGSLGQAQLGRCHVGILGLGGIGSLVAEYLGRLGVERFLLVDSDRVEISNLSRIVGAELSDAQSRSTKVEVSRRLILQANPKAKVRIIADDMAKDSVARSLRACDYLFLAADSMRARLVFNAIVHQYLIPGVQMGSKIRANSEGGLLDVMNANRPVRPGRGCLWCNQLIDPNLLAKEAKTDQERRDQAYGVEEENPSVISLNAVAAAHAVNDFLLDYLNLRRDAESLSYEHFHHLKRQRMLVSPRRDEDCSECSPTGPRYGRGDSVDLPSIEG